jgi:hypothetical protein
MRVWYDQKGGITSKSMETIVLYGQTCYFLARTKRTRQTDGMNLFLPVNSFCSITREGYNSDGNIFEIQNI